MASMLTPFTPLNYVLDPDHPEVNRFAKWLNRQPFVRAVVGRTPGVTYVNGIDVTTPEGSETHYARALEKAWFAYTDRV